MEKTTSASAIRPDMDFTTSPPANWPVWRREELERNTRNGRVGSTLVSVSDHVRVWHLVLRPGERLPFHRHVLDYFWTVTQPGRSRSHYGSGEVRERDNAVGDTQHFRFGAGESMIHDLENIGDTPLGFVTVEFLDSANPPLDV
jgi:mannose-6-phosphate isomerase-like protein (cupin superfamily)